jgi:hypothetical protein
MYRRTAMTIMALTGSVLIVFPGNVAAQSAKDLVGTWTAVTAEAYGPTPKGSLIFDANGRYSLQLMRPDLPKFAANNRLQGTPAEYKATVEGSISYFGTYAVNGKELILRVEGSTFPNWTGTEQKRTNLSVTADELKYTNTAPSGGGGNTPLVWRRVK